MDKITRLTSEQRSNLVAYLDGELDEDEAREIERVLASNPVARNEVEILQRTWEMLDTLPQARASEEFTRNTLTSLRLAEVHDPLFERPWFRQARRGGLVAGWIGGLALAAVFGFLITSEWVPNESELLVEELPIVEKLDLYSEIGDIEFLRELRRTGLIHERQPSSNQ